MIDNSNEQTKEFDKLYFSYIRTLYSLFSYSLNQTLEKDHIEVNKIYPETLIRIKNNPIRNKRQHSVLYLNIDFMNAYSGEFNIFNLK
jgi:hypothetical protein